MFAKRFTAQLVASDVSERLTLVGCLAEVYCELPAESPFRADVTIAMVAVLDDPSPKVRERLASGIQFCADIPHSLLKSFSLDAADVAAPLIISSPSWPDGWLAALARSEDCAHHMALAHRLVLTTDVVAELAAHADADVCLALLKNSGAQLTRRALSTIVSRHGDDGAIRELLLARSDLPAILRRRLMGRVTGALDEFVGRMGWLGNERRTRMMSDEQERIAVDIAGQVSAEELPGYAADILRDHGPSLTLLLRCLLNGEFALFEETFCQLSGLPERRVSQLLRDPSGRGFGSLYRRSKLDPEGAGVLAAAMSVFHEMGGFSVPEAREKRRVLERVLTRYADQCGDRIDAYLEMLSRFQAEEMRVAVRQITGDAKVAPPPRLLIDVDEIDVGDRIEPLASAA